LIIFTPLKTVKEDILEVLFGTENSFLCLLVCLLVASGITVLVYYRNKELKELGKWQVRILVFLRFLTVLLLAVLILSPMLKTLKRYIQTPVVITAFDNSSSMVSYADSTEARHKLERIYDRLQTELTGDFRLVNYTFGEGAETGHIPDFNEKKSDYSQLINTVYTNHFNENVGAMILVGDGIYNRGTNPLSDIRKLNFPVHSVGIGDTNIVKDAAIADIRVNRNAFVGNLFPVEINLRFEKMANEPAILEVRKENEVVYNRRIVPVNDDHFLTTTFTLEANTPGLQHYTVWLNTPARENNIRNNRSEYVIHVLENKQKILLLSEGSHPDIGAIRNILEQQQNFEVSVFTREPYPANMNDFNLIILNQIPSAGSTGWELVTKSLESKASLLFIVGNQTFIPRFNQLGLEIEMIPQAQNPEEAQPVLNEDFKLFTMEMELREMLEKFPPLQSPFAETEMDPAYSVMLYQNLKNIETQRPLLALGNINGRKTGVLFGEGIWRWRLYNYYFNESHRQFTDFIVSIAQYLSLRENEDNFHIDFQPVYYDTDPVILNAEVYNESFERINEPEINIRITHENGNVFPFVFDHKEDYYRLNAGKLTVGRYHFNATVQIGKNEYTESGSFEILPLQIENINTRADFNLLFQLSSLAGGEFFYENEISQLTGKILENENIRPTTYFQASLTELLNLKWLFLVLIVLAGMEWFLRKFWGIY